ncbi:MAG: cation diffusion facilitator family transporter [Desulfobaccales bacterium]
MEPGERLALISVAVNLTVTALKYFFGVFAGSLALLADAVHSTADVVSSASIWAGLRISRRKSKRFPYGLYKVENLVALGTSGLILLAGYEIFRTTLAGGETIKAERLPYAVGGVILIGLILLLFSRYELKKALELNSPSLKADAHHLTTDLFANAVVLISLAGSYWRPAFPLDQIGAGIIVVLIAWVGLGIAVDAIRVLLDASLDFDTLNRIREIILQVPQVERVISLTGRNSGPYKFIEADLALRVNELEKAHFLANLIEKHLKEQVPNIDHILIHYEPVAKETRVVALPVAADRQHLSEHFGEAPYFFLLTLKRDGNRVLEEKWLSNPHQSEEKAKGIKVSEWLVGLGVDEVITAKPLEHRGPYYVLADNQVEMRHTDLRDLRDITSSLLQPAGAPAEIQE